MIYHYHVAVKQEDVRVSVLEGTDSDYILEVTDEKGHKIKIAVPRRENGYHRKCWDSPDTYFLNTVFGDHY